MAVDRASGALPARGVMEICFSFQRAGETGRGVPMNEKPILYARGAKLPKGWYWGAWMATRGSLIGYHAIRESDDFAVFVVDSAEADAPSPAAAIRAAIAEGLIPMAQRRR